MLNYPKSLFHEAHEAAKDTLIRQVAFPDNQGRLRYAISDLRNGGRIIKKFQAHHVGTEVNRWINQKWPEGVYVWTGPAFNKIMLRIGKKNHVTGNVTLHQMGITPPTVPEWAMASSVPSPQLATENDYLAPEDCEDVPAPACSLPAP